jgi:hypothetical protein
MHAKNEIYDLVPYPRKSASATKFHKTVKREFQF